MKIENHISDILQLYEFSMAIGKSLNYKESCNQFLKLLLKRKNLNAAWILEQDDNQLLSRYSIPLGQEVNVVLENPVRDLLDSIKDSKIIESNALIQPISPINIDKGTVAVFNLEEQGFLFLFSIVDNIQTKDLLQLQPVIHKFSVSLKASKAFSEQQQLLSHLESRNQELSDYAHMVSHDLKSPLRSIDTLTAWLKEDYNEKFDKQGQQQLDLIRDSVEKMDTLINGILKYSTIAKNQIETYKVDTNQLIVNILKIIQVPNHITITIQQLPVIMGDKYRLQQLFQNLIDNAIAYNDKPKGTIDIGANDKGEFWEFYISDNGKGIESVYFDKIFQTFESLESNVSSTGIGLAIVKKIVNLYGGKVWLTSELNKGTTFYFTIKKQ